MSDRASGAVSDVTAAPLLPPGFTGKQSAQPWQDGLREAASGGAAGTLIYAPIDRLLDVALILSPDQPDAERAAVRIATLAVFGALIAIAPPEMTVTIASPGVIAVNRGEVSTMQTSCGPRASDDIPQWIVLGFVLRLAMGLEAPGLTPWLTDLTEEGFELSGAALLESICRHLLSMFDLWQTEGGPGLARAWRAATAAGPA